MPWNLLIFPLLGGFIFIHKCQLFRFRAHRLESERLILESAVWGTGLFILARLLADQFQRLSWGKWLFIFIQHEAPFPFAGTALVSLLAGYFSAQLVNQILRLMGGQEWVRLAVASNYDDGLIKLLYGLINDESPVLVTLSSRKVYAGYVSVIPETAHDGFIELILIISGFRDTQSLQFRETENYAAMTLVSDDPDVEPVDFRITISIPQILSANRFDVSLYNLHFASKAQPKKLVATDPASVFTILSTSSLHP